MNSLELANLCTFKCFLGVFASDQLPTDVPRPSCMIVNTDDSSKSGKHWISIFINKEGYGDFFCSYGRKPLKVFVDFLDKNCFDWNYNSKRIQGDGTTCGQYAVFFLFCRSKGASLQKFLSLFANDFNDNDILVTTFINAKFNVNTKIFNPNIFE